jgi:hypothetical protein
MKPIGVRTTPARAFAQSRKKKSKYANSTSTAPPSSLLSVDSVEACSNSISAFNRIQSLNL